MQCNDTNLDKEIDDLEHEICKIYGNKAKGAQVSSSENYVDVGDKYITVNAYSTH